MEYTQKLQKMFEKFTSGGYKHFSIRVITESLDNFNYTTVVYLPYTSYKAIASTKDESIELACKKAYIEITDPSFMQALVTKTNKSLHLCMIMEKLYANNSTIAFDMMKYLAVTDFCTTIHKVTDRKKRRETERAYRKQIDLYADYSARLNTSKFKPIATIFENKVSHAIESGERTFNIFEYVFKLFNKATDNKAVIIKPVLHVTYEDGRTEILE